MVELNQSINIIDHSLGDSISYPEILIGWAAGASAAGTIKHEYGLTLTVKNDEFWFNAGWSVTCYKNETTYIAQEKIAFLIE